MFDFESVALKRWRIVSTGWAMPPGVYSVEFEWENGEDASFSSASKDLHTWAEQWMEDHEDDPDFWDGSTLPELLTSHDWGKTEAAF